MPLSAFLASRRRSKASTLMMPGKQIEREGYFSIRQKIPPHAMQHVAIDAGDANSLPAQPRRLPREAVPSPRHHGMKADEQQEPLCYQRSHLDDWLQCDVSGVLWLCRVNDVGVAACDGAHLERVGAGKHSCGHRRIGKPESAR